MEGRQHPAISVSGYIPKGENVSVIGGEEQSLIVKSTKRNNHYDTIIASRIADLNIGLYFIIFVVAIILIMILTILGKFISLWFQAFVSGTPIPLFNIVGMSLRKIPPREIVNARINLFKAGLKTITVADLETHYPGGRACSKCRRSSHCSGQSQHYPRLEAGDRDRPGREGFESGCSNFCQPARD